MPTRAFCSANCSEMFESKPTNRSRNYLWCLRGRRAGCSRRAGPGEVRGMRRSCRQLVDGRGLRIGVRFWFWFWFWRYVTCFEAAAFGQFYYFVTKI